MKIEFTKDEYRVLLDVVYLADWVVNSFKTSDECIPEFEALGRKVFSFARGLGFDGLVKREGGTEEYAESKAFEDSVKEKGYISELFCVYWLCHIYHSCGVSKYQLIHSSQMQL